MSKSVDTTSQAFFEAKYQADVDPWNFATSSYELNRYAAIINSLKPRFFQMAFEGGCSVGVLTRQLSAICRHVHAIDISPSAVKQAIDRCSDLTNVDIKVGSLLTDVPTASFDLVVLSEIGYYFTPEELTSIGTNLIRRMQPGGTLLAAHWLGHSEDHLASGDSVHELIDSLPGMDRTFSDRQHRYRINHWRKR